MHNGKVTSLQLADSHRRAMQAQKQRKLEERVVRVLDATEAFAMRAENVEDLTSALIAELSEVSIGWLYEHIGDRQAVVDLVLVRSMKDLQKAVVTVGLDLSSPDWRDGVDLLVDTVVNFMRSRRGYARLYYSRLAGPNAAEVNYRIDQETAGMYSLTPLGLSGTQARVVASVFTGMIDKGLELSYRSGEVDMTAIMEQTKVAAKAYLATFKS